MTEVTHGHDGVVDEAAVEVQGLAHPHASETSEAGLPASEPVTRGQDGSEAGSPTAADDAATEPAPEASVPAPGDPTAGAPAPAGSGVEERREEVRFAVEVPGYRGSLEGLVSLAQRGEVDLAAVPVSRITADFRRSLATEGTRPDPRDVADFLQLAARLLALKANRLLPDGPLQPLDVPADEEGDVDDPGRRLAEYRLFKAAAEALLSDAAEQGARSFLGLVAPEVVPVERLRISPERLAAAFRAVLERIPEVEPFQVDLVTFSVEEKGTRLREQLRSARSLRFEQIFAEVRSRLEAVAIFLALLELLKSGEARVEQPEAFGDIVVSAGD